MHISPPAPLETSRRSTRWVFELPHGMPKDFQLLPPHSQDLLRAARSGRLYKRPLPVEEEEHPEGEAAIAAAIAAGAPVGLAHRNNTAPAHIGPTVAEKAAEKKEEPIVDGYKIKVWKQVPRNTEGATVSHLAKRHKGTIQLPSKTSLSQTSGPTVTRATVRRIDAAGNPYEQTITLAEGQRVDGEIISTSVVPVPSAGGKCLSQQPTPQRRKPPPPRRKAKGSGRGRKKNMKLMPPSGSRPAQNGTATVDESKPGPVAEQVRLRRSTTTTASRH